MRLKRTSSLAVEWRSSRFGQFVKGKSPRHARNPGREGEKESVGLRGGGRSKDREDERERQRIDDPQQQRRRSRQVRTDARRPS